MKYTKEYTQELYNEYNEEKISTLTLDLRHELPRGTTCQLFHWAALPMRAPTQRVMKPKITPSIQEMVVKYYNQGSSQAELARDYDTTPPTIRKYLMQAGVVKRKGTGPRQDPAIAQAIVRLRRRGKLWKDIREKLHVSYPVISRVLQANHMTTRRNVHG